MKKLPCIVALLLGVAFILFGVAHFVPAVKAILPAPTPPNGEEAGKLTQAFFAGLAGSGYLSVIKGLEILAGVLLILKCTRGWGIVLSGAILFNIFFVNVLIMNIWNPIVIAMVLAGLYLAFAGRQGFRCLACCGSGECLASCGLCPKDGSCGSGEKKTGCCG
ncbi:MAG: hypothetical protein FJ410_07880 [Verrucomicrobia bacterium]|nr:hypothetical protein [Verrucomicrobiota bacterium]